MGILDASAGASGNQTSAQSASAQASHSVSDSWSRTYGSEATAKSYAEAINATERQKELMLYQNAYNAEEAEKQRMFNYLMGNSIYTRSIENMKQAGINPILAAGFGLSGATVASGAAASNSTPSAFMGQTFADQASASHSESHSEGWSQSSSSGSGWSNSESGLATAITSLGKMFSDGLNALNSAFNINLSLQGFQEASKDYDKAMSEIRNKDTGDSNMNSYRDTVTRNNQKQTGNNTLLKILNNLQLKATGAK